MRYEILILALLVGSCNWAFRYFPTRIDLNRLYNNSGLMGFIAATGSAAIASLFAASVMPSFGSGGWAEGFPAVAGLSAVIIAYGVTRQVIVASFAGALVYGLTFL
ncbi:MAG: hypothetical protein RIR95_2218 [Pseudomonadota bacterium]